MSSHSSGEAPFTVLVTELQKASRSQGFISIDPSTFKLLKDAAQPLGDSSLHDAVKLLETANKQACLRLEPASFSCVVWAAFHVKPSLLQQRLLHVLLSSYVMLKDETKAIVYFDNLMGAGKVDMPALRSRRKGILQPLVKMLFALLYEVSRGGLRITAAEFLFAIVHADIDAKRVIFDGAEKWRHLLGSIVQDITGDYVLRLVAANLIRELLVGRFDLHQFWPSTTPAASYMGFPLGEAADSRWLYNFAAHASDLDVNRAFHGNELSEVVRAQGLEVDSVTMTKTPLLAILSSAVTFVWPSEDRTCLHRLEVPVMDVMEVQQEENHISVHYTSSSGYKISQGARSELRHLRLRVEDAAHVLHDSILIADKLSANEKEKIKIGRNSSQRSAHALVDLSQSSPSTGSLVGETSTGVGKIRVSGTGRIGQQRPDSGILPRARQSKAVGKNDGIEAQLPSGKDKTNLIDIATQALTASAPKMSCAPRSSSTSNEDRSVISKHKSTATLKSTVMAPQHNTQARKRPSEEMKSKTQSESRIDWDEGLRAEAADSYTSTQKKAKTRSTPASKSAAATSKKPNKGTNKKAQAVGDAKSKTGPTSQTKDKSRLTAATTRPSRGKANRPIHYTEDSDSDEDEDDAEQEVLFLVKNSGPKQVSKHAAVTARSGKDTRAEDRLEVGDSQDRDQAPGTTSHASEDLESMIDELSDFTPPPGRSTEQQPQPQPEESAHDSHYMANATHTQILQENDRSFGSALKDALGLPDIGTSPTNSQVTGRAFGNSKSFLQDVNANKNSSPRKVTPQPRSRAQRTDNTASPHQLNLQITDYRMEQQIQPPKTTKARLSQHSQIRQKQPAAQRKGKHDDSKLSSRDLGVANRSESADEEGILADDAESAVVLPRGPSLHRTPGASISLTRETVAPAAAQETTMDVIPPDRSYGQTDRPSARKVTFTEVRTTTRTFVEEDKEIAGRRRSGTAHPKTAAKTQQPGASVEQSSVRPSAPVVSKQEKTRTPKEDTTVGAQLTSDNAPVAGDESSVMTDERMKRKTQLVSFGAKGPKNQGTLLFRKSISIDRAADAMPSETRKHHDFKKQPVGRPSPVPLKFSVPSDATRQQVQSMEISDDSDEDDRIVVQEEAGPAVRRTASGRNASQGSIVDQNGSPRLHAPREPRRPLPPIQEPSSELVEESSVDASEEQEGSEYTESSPLKSKAVAPTAVNDKPASTKFVQSTKAKMIQARESIGLNEQLIQKFPQAKRSIVTKVFKTRAEPAMSIAPVVLDKPNETAIQAAPLHKEPMAKVQQTVVTRLRPKTPVEEPRLVVRSSSKTPASFNSRMQERMMPPPPVPEKHKQDDEHIQGSKGKVARRSSVLQDVDQTLIGLEDSDEAQEQRASPLRRRQPSSDSSSSSDSDYDDPRRDAHKKGLFRGDGGSLWNVQPRQTQQAMQALFSECVNLVVFRMAKAEGAISVKVHQYHVGSMNIISTFQSTFDSTIDHHMKKGNPRVGDMCERYRNAIEQGTGSARRVNQGPSMDELEAAIKKRQAGVIGMIQDAIYVNGAQQEQVG